MLVLRPEDSRLATALQRACDTATPSAASIPVALVLCAGVVEPERLEPFATLSTLIEGEADCAEPALRLVVCDAWPFDEWSRQLDEALIETRLRLSRDQRRRALHQGAADGSLEVLFVDRGAVRGSALTLVSARQPGAPLPLESQAAALQLLEAARDAFHPAAPPLCRLLGRARASRARLPEAKQSTRTNAPRRAGRIGLIEFD